MTVAQPQRLPRYFLDPPGPFHLTLLIFLGSVALFVSATVGHFYWGWPAWLSFCSNVVALHIVGTVIHEASHNSAHPNRIVNAVLGHGSALLLGFAFPVFTRVHLQHHANVNDPKNDPDHLVSTAGPLWLIAPRFFYHEIFFFRRRLWRKYELLEWVLTRLCLVALIGLSVYFGVIHALLNFWFVPALIVGTLYGLFFDYFPHRPFQERRRLWNSRIYANPLVNILIMGQNYHLIHHLWPSMPWYRAQSAYYAIQPFLEEKGCHLTFGIFDSFSNFRSFLYDVFVGVRFEDRSESHPSPLTEESINAVVLSDRADINESVAIAPSQYLVHH